MKLEDAIRYAFEGKAILFAGSGFSYGAQNYKGQSFKTGGELCKSLAQECGIEDTNYPLSSVAEYYLSLEGHTPETLIDFLTKEFTLGSISQDHRTIMSVKWKRIYTTNYDQVIEEGAKNNQRILSSVTVEDPIDLYSKENVCVHLNGLISQLTSETLNNSFKLIDRSYDYSTLVGKPWFDFMERDFASAKAIIIVGFSMQSDIDIRRIIAQPSISQKVVFVMGPNPNPIDKNTLRKYATVESIGVNGLARKISEQKDQFVSSAIFTPDYTTFVHEHMTPQEKLPIRLEDLTAFYYMGDVRKCIIQKNITGEYPALTVRDAVDVFMRERSNYKVFLAISNLGNGKTLLCNLIRNELREIDIDVFTFRKENVDTDYEIEQICNTYKNKSIVVIIDDYYKHLNVLRRFSDFGNLSKITFLLTSRNTKVATNYRRLVNMLRVSENDVKPLYLNTMSSREIKQLAEVLLLNNLHSNDVQSDSLEDVTQYIQSECKSSISNVVTKLFDSSYIKKELLSIYSRAVKEEVSAISELAIAMIASEVMNLGLSTDEIVKLLDIDFVILQINESELISELFDTESNQLKVKSSIIAKKILNDVIPVENLLLVLKKMLVTADKLRVNNQNYAEVMKGIISHANFLYWIKKSEHIQAIKVFFDELRLLSFFSSRNPFYWEQFASICIDAKDYPTAEQCLKNAFEEAKKIPEFVPFQVETVYARYLVSKLRYNMSLGVIEAANILETLLDASSRLTKYYNHPEDEHYRTFQLFDNMVDIFKQNLSHMDKRNTSMFLERMVHYRKLLIKYQEENESRYFPSTKTWLENIDITIDMSKKHMKD